jgi:aconitate hydratase
LPFRLTQTVLEAHGLERVPPERERDAVLPQVDQVLLGRDHAPLVVALLERAGVAVPRVRTVLAETGRGDAGGEVPAGSDWRRLALARGLLLPRPGHGAAEVLHRERLAAPGRLVLCAGPLPACGAVGMLALGADALEVTAVLAGGGLMLRTPRAVAAELTGAPPPGAGGADVALALLVRLRESGAAADVIEFGGDGVGALPMAERVSAAWLLAQAGLPSLFPSDEITRAALAALGRDQDWRHLDTAADGGGTAWSIALGSLEALVAPAAELAAARPVRSSEGMAIERVLVGPAATLEDLACLAERLRGRRVAERTECTVVAGSRALLDRAAAAGIAARLAEAGVRVVEGEASAQATGAGTGLCFGLPLSLVAEGRGRWFVGGVESAAAAAVAGALTVPAPGEGERPGPVAASGTADAEPWLSAQVAEEVAPSPSRALAPAPRHRWRGEVLVVLGDEVDGGTLLAPGARLEEMRGRLRALAGALFAGIEPGFAERARRWGGGWVVAGTGFLRGEVRAAVAVCMAEAGVWGILARSYAPGAARTLAHAGVIPFVVAADGPRQGDEVEVAGLPEALIPGHPVAARNLTRGVHLSLAHDLSAREIAILRAGGLTAFAVQSRPRGEEE